MQPAHYQHGTFTKTYTFQNGNSNFSNKNSNKKICNRHIINVILLLNFSLFQNG